MSDVELPPQKSDTDTTNWDSRVLTAPKVTSVSKIIKNKERREMILNSPERKRSKYRKNPDITRAKN